MVNLKFSKKIGNSNFKNPKQYFCDLREKYRFEDFTPIGSHVNESKEK